MTDRIAKVFERFDSYNKLDPNQFVWEGKSYPQEYFLAVKLHEWVLKLDPNPGEALLLASRCQHIGRWEIPRNSYPMDREGYLKWRKDLGIHHAEKAKEILVEAGYPGDVIEDVEHIILKKKIKVNSVVQTMENALCLVFLDYQYEDFFPKHEDKIVNILKKSLLKMDAEGHRYALSLNYSPEGYRYIQEALALLTGKV